MYRIFNSIHKYPRAVYVRGRRARVYARACSRTNTRARALHVRATENVNVSSLFSPSLRATTACLSLFLSVSLSFSRAICPSSFFSFFPYTISIHRVPSLPAPRSLVSSSRRRARRETGEIEPREPRRVTPAKNEVAYFLRLVTNRLSFLPGGGDQRAKQKYSPAGARPTDEK